MIDRSETHVVISTVVAAPAAGMFAVLADPSRHAELDGSGMVRAAAAGSRTVDVITGVGQVFTMQMQAPTLGAYRTDNHVVEFEPGRRIAWMPAREGRPPAGVCWTWEFEAAGPGTRVTHSYDWSAVTDPEVLARVSFPLVRPEQMRTTMQRLAAVSPT